MSREHGPLDAESYEGEGVPGPTPSPDLESYEGNGYDPKHAEDEGGLD